MAESENEQERPASIAMMDLIGDYFTEYPPAPGMARAG
jgi:hypothetical protein